LPRLFGFELLMALYAMAHLKLGMQLAAQDLPQRDRELFRYGFESDERLQLYLTNTLEQVEQHTQQASASSSGPSAPRLSRPDGSNAITLSSSFWAIRPTRASLRTRAIGSTGCSKAPCPMARAAPRRPRAITTSMASR
jgi:hypothetical protein